MMPLPLRVPVVADVEPPEHVELLLEDLFVDDPAPPTVRVDAIGDRAHTSVPGALRARIEALVAPLHLRGRLGWLLAGATVLAGVGAAMLVLHSRRA